MTTTLVVAILGSPMAVVSSWADAPVPPVAVETFTRDVFVLSAATLVHPDATTTPTATLYNVNGAALGVSWGQWEAATATVQAMTTGGATNTATNARFELEGLVPGGLYSVFYGTLSPDSSNPGCPGVERTLPFTSFPRPVGPDASSFVADQAGGADYRGQVPGAVLTAGTVFFEVIYHFNGKTYDPFPNALEEVTQGPNCRSSFGDDAMRQLLIIQKQ